MWLEQKKTNKEDDLCRQLAILISGPEMSLTSFSVWSGKIYTKSYAAAKTQLFSFISTEVLSFSQHGSFVAACVQQKRFSLAVVMG